MYTAGIVLVGIPLTLLAISLYLDFTELLAMGAWKAGKKLSDIVAYILSRIRHKAAYRKAGGILSAAESETDRIQKAVKRAKAYAMMYDADEATESAKQRVFTKNVTWRLYK